MQNNTTTKPLNQNKMIWNILPMNDLKEHIEESTCECGPSVEILENGDMMIIHNSYDGREILEQLNAPD